MINRRKFIEKVAVAGALSLVPNIIKSQDSSASDGIETELPVIISTWNHGIDANEAAMSVLNNGGTVVDAVEQGVWIPEADPDNMSVGIGGFPDREGHVTLDASIMGPDGNAGSVCFLENIVHPISVARLVMDSTPHVMLSGEGALQFALENGFEKQNLLTPAAEKAWKNNYLNPATTPNLTGKMNQINFTTQLVYWLLMVMVILPEPVPPAAWASKYVAGLAIHP